MLEALDIQAVRPAAVSSGKLEFWNLLKLLEQDLPDYILGDFCEKLHRTRLLADINILPLSYPGYHITWEPRRAKEDHYRKAYLYFYPWLTFDRIQSDEASTLGSRLAALY